MSLSSNCITVFFLGAGELLEFKALIFMAFFGFLKAQQAKLKVSIVFCLLQFLF